MEWVRSRVSLQQQEKEDDRIQEPRRHRVTAEVAVGRLLWGAFGLPFFFFLMSPRLPAWQESAWHEERKERCSRGKTAPALLDLKPQQCSLIILPDSGGGAKRLMVSDKNSNTHYHEQHEDNYSLMAKNTGHTGSLFPRRHPSFALYDVVLYINFKELDLTNRAWTQLRISC